MSLFHRNEGETGSGAKAFALLACRTRFCSEEFIMRRIGTFVIAMLLVAHGLQAEEMQEKRSRLSYGASAGWVYLLGVDKYARELIKSPHGAVYNVYGAYRALLSDSSRYDMAFGYPTIRGGLMLVDYSRVRLHMDNRHTPYDSELGYMVAAYAAFKRDVVRASRFTLAYSFENGLGFCTRPYNPADNVDNEIIGSPLSIYFGFGVQARMRVAPSCEVFVEGEFKHFSNGALDRPNKGANTVGLSAGVRYYPAGDQPKLPVRNKFQRAYGKNFYCDLSVGWAAKSFLDEWFLYYYLLSPEDARYRTADYPIYSALSVSVAPMFRYRLKFASGIGVDYMYVPYAEQLKRINEEKSMPGLLYSPHSLGVSLRHEVFYKHLSLYFSLGYYLFRQMGKVPDEADESRYGMTEKETPYYETIGLRFYVPRLEWLYIGYHVKAHLSKADCMVLNVGVRLGKMKNWR